MSGFNFSTVFLILLVLLYIFIEIHYFLRMFLCIFVARHIKKRSYILDSTCVSGICFTNDVDTLLSHMNNVRYFRELDFARADFYERTQLYRTIISKGGSVFQGAATIRYRRFIRPFNRFIITSRIVYWDDSSLYMEHRFLRPSDQFIHAIAVCRQRVINCSAQKVMSELLLKKSSNQINNIFTTVDNKNIDSTKGDLDAQEHSPVSDEISLPSDLKMWIEYNDLSSKILREDI